MAKKKILKFGTGPFIPYEVKVSYDRFYPGKDYESRKWKEYIASVILKMRKGGSFACKQKDHLRLSEIRKNLKRTHPNIKLRFSNIEAPKDQFFVFKLS